MGAVLNIADGFAPVTHDEIVNAAKAVSANDDADIVTPIPSDAPPLPTSHPLHGQPVAHWLYHDAAGHILFAVFRFEPEGDRKQILPATLWRDTYGQMRWRWKGYPAPRPLYNLDKLALSPDASVVVVEGEKAADSAALLFPKSVSATSPGGSQAAPKTDWTVLASRRVLIWADADPPGLKYQREVADLLVAIGCEVSIIDAMALASISPDGSRREPITGWDAADALQEWTDLKALRKAVGERMKPYEPGPSFISYGSFKMSSVGLSVSVKRGKTDTDTVDEHVSGPFEVLGEARDPSGREWAKVLRWQDGDGRQHVRHVAASTLQGDPAALAASLASDGLRINRSQQKALASYLCGAAVKGRVTMVQRTGWHVVGNHAVFVLPGETIGPRGAETVILDAAAVGPYETRGSLANWQAGVGALSEDHALAVLAISAALAGPLLYLAGQEGGGVHFVGASSRGKSTIQACAASVWGPGGSPGFVRSWRATANGLEGAAASATDTCLVLDEMGMIEPREMAAAVYGLANGTGKQRAARDGSLREPKSWRVMVVSSGELTISAKIAEDRGKRAKAGQLIRLLDVPADRGFGFGAFDHAGSECDAAKLSTALKTAAMAAYGTAGPEFVRKLITAEIDGEAVRSMVADFIGTYVPAGADGQVDRAGQRFGLIAAAGELAVVLGVLPWREGAASAAASWALSQWIDGRGGAEPHEVRQAIEAVRLIIEQHGESRFEIVGGDGDPRPVINRLGWRKGDGSDREWWIPPEVWKAEVCAGLEPLFVAKALSERGFLRVQGGRGFQCKVNLGGDRRANVYVLTAAILDGGDDAS